MKTTVLMLVSFLLCSCLHMEKAGTTPLSYRVTDNSGNAVAGAMVWISHSMPGGIVGPADKKAFGPYYTDASGKVDIPSHSFSMLQTGTIFDGDTEGVCTFVHPQLGAFMCSLYPTKNVIKWPKIGRRGVAYSFKAIDHLPEPARTIASKYAGRN